MSHSDTDEPPADYLLSDQVKALLSAFIEQHLLVSETVITRRRHLEPLVRDMIFASVRRDLGREVAKRAQVAETPPDHEGMHFRAEILALTLAEAIEFTSALYRLGVTDALPILKKAASTELAARDAIAKAAHNGGRGTDATEKI